MASQNKQQQTMDDLTSQFLKHYVENQRRIYGLIRSLVPRCQDADDVMQETTAVMWQKFREFQPGTNFSAWGNRIAHLLVLKHYQKNKNLPSFKPEILDEITKDAHILNKQMTHRLDALLSCLKKLSSDDRELVKWRYEQNTSVKEISQKQNIASHTIYRSLGRIHNCLLDCIKRHMAVETSL